MEFYPKKLNAFVRFLSKSCFAFWVMLAGCEGRGSQPEPVSISSNKETQRSYDYSLTVPKQEDVRDFVGSTQYDFPSDDDGSIAIFDRVLDAFQAGTAYLTTDDGYRIMWGFKFKEASFQSIAIVDRFGNLSLIGAVTDVVPLVHGRASVVSSVREYQDKIKSTMSDPADVTLFVDPNADLLKIIPLVKRWLQADLMGFNASCDDELYRQACELLPYIEIPITVFKVNKANADAKKNYYELKKIELPNVPESNVPLEKFTQ